MIDIVVVCIVRNEYKATLLLGGVKSLDVLHDVELYVY